MKTAEERYDEIKREIIQISESYTLIMQNMNKEQPTKYEQRHILLLQMKLNDLIEELNSMKAAQEITISLLYKNIVNSLKRSLVGNCAGEYQEEIYRDIKLNQYLF